MNPTFPMLVADIGGTTARFAWIPEAHASLQSIEAVTVADYPCPEDAAAAYLKKQNIPDVPAKAAIAIASAVVPGPIKVTNSHWIFDRIAFSKGIGTATVDVYNDFEAIAMVLPYLSPTDYRIVGAVRPDPLFSMGVIGPGTGLGVAGILPARGSGNAWQTICGEGGHVTLACNTDYLSAIIAATRQEHSHVSAERLISGIGLPTLRRAVATVNGLTPVGNPTAEEIGTLGAARADILCEKTMEAFCCLLGSVAGNVALTLGARGGIFVAGGIVPKLGEFFYQSGFRQHFETKGRCTEYLESIATAVITAEFPGLLGLAMHSTHQN